MNHDIMSYKNCKLSMLNIIFTKYEQTLTLLSLNSNDAFKLRF